MSEPNAKRDSGEGPKVIELTETDVEILKHGRGTPLSIVDVLENGEDFTVKLPQRKQVHLSDLPDGTLVKKGSFPLYVFRGNLFLQKGANGCYDQMYDGGNIKLIQGDWQVWQGGEGSSAAGSTSGACPWPEGVEVEVEYIAYTGGVPMRCKTNGEALQIWQNHSEIIAHRCIGLMPDYELVP